MSRDCVAWLVAAAGVLVLGYFVFVRTYRMKKEVSWRPTKVSPDHAAAAAAAAAGALHRILETLSI